MTMPENVAPMMALYMWLGVGFARDAVVANLKSEGMEDAAIEEVFAQEISKWRIQIIGTYVVTGVVCTLIRKLMPADAPFGLLFSLGGALLIVMAIMATQRFFRRPHVTPTP